MRIQYSSPRRVSRLGRVFKANWVAVLWGFCELGVAQEIAPFRITGVEGYNNLRYVSDQFTTTQPGADLAPDTLSKRVQSVFREELFVMTHSYVYHPNLLSLDVGIGPILQRSSFLDDAGETTSSSALYNFSARAKLLRDKPYNGSLFYEHLNPTVIVAPGQAITQQTTRYGADLALTAPFVSVPTFVDFSRSQTQGRGADRIVDDQIDQFNVRASRNFADAGSTQLQYHASQQTSRSGSPNLPIQGSNSSTQAFSADTRYQFGPAREYDLANLFTVNTMAYTLQGQNAVPDRTDGRMSFDLRGRNTRELQSSGSVNHSWSRQGAQSSTVDQAVVGFNYSPGPAFSVSGSMHAEGNQSNQLTSSVRGVEGAMRYQITLPLGVLQTGYALRHDQRNQVAVAATANVIGERTSLVGTTYATLSQRHVNAASVVIVNAARNQTFVEGSDYILSSVGTETRLQRLIGGAILDGQDVLVDYAYDLGGTFGYSQTDQTLDLNWSPGSYFSTYFRYLDSAPRVTSGNPAFPLNTVHSRVYGLRFDVPAKSPLEMVLGGSMEREDRRETLSSYRRATEEMYAQLENPFFGAGNIRVSVRHAKVEYDYSLQNVNLRAVDARYWGRFLSGVEVSANLATEVDTGGPVLRRRLVTTVKLDWRYRKLKMTFDLGRTVETQGRFRRAPVLLQMQARREF